MLRKLRAQMSYANVMASIAVFVSLGGTGYALSRNSVGARELKPNAVRASELAPRSVVRGDLRFPLGEAAGNGMTATTPQTLAAGADYASVASTRLVTRKKGLIALLTGAVTITNPSKVLAEPVTVSVRVLANGKPEDGTFQTTIPSGFSDTVPVSIMCNAGIPVGEHTFTLQVKSTGAVTVGSRTLNAVSFGPIFHPPG